MSYGHGRRQREGLVGATRPAARPACVKKSRNKCDAGHNSWGERGGVLPAGAAVACRLVDRTPPVPAARRGVGDSYSTKARCDRRRTGNASVPCATADIQGYAPDAAARRIIG